jgi:hypothetical protein
MTEADFLQFLSEHGLTAVDGARTIEQLGRQYGVGRWYDFIEVVYLPPSPLFSENRERFYIPRYTPTTLVPPAEFCCDFDFTGAGFKNHQLALERFSELFGTPEKGVAVNTWSHSWSFERANLELTTFMREKNRGYNPLYQKHPELWEKCSIRIRIDPIRPLSEEEKNYLLSLPETDRLEFPTQNRWERSLAYPAWRRGCLPTNQLVCWRDRSKARIGWYHASSAVFWEASICSGIKLVRLSPGRGSGSATVYLVMRNPFSRGHEEVTEVVLQDDDWNGLNVAAQRLGEFWDLSLRVEEYPDE